MSNEIYRGAKPRFGGVFYDIIILTFLPGWDIRKVELS